MRVPSGRCCIAARSKLLLTCARFRHGRRPPGSDPAPPLAQPLQMQGRPRSTSAPCPRSDAAASRAPPPPAPGWRLFLRNRPVLGEQVRRFARPLVRQLFVRLAEQASTRGTSMWMSPDPRSARSEIGPVQQGARACPERSRRNPLLVATDHRIRAGALIRLVTTPKTRSPSPPALYCQTGPEASVRDAAGCAMRTGVHLEHESRARRPSEARLSSGQASATLLERMRIFGQDRADCDPREPGWWTRGGLGFVSWWWRATWRSCASENPPECLQNCFSVIE